MATPGTKITDGSFLLDAEQKTAFRIQYWDTAFTPLSGDLASDGLTITVREPVNVKHWHAYAETMKAASVDDLAGAFADDSDGRSIATVTNGRVPNLIESWSGGAPAWYGVTQRSRVAIHWSMQLRSPDARSWFSSDVSPAFYLAAAGSGWLRVLKTINGITSEVLLDGKAGKALTETDYLTDGFVLSEVLDVLSPGDSLDIYYIQDAEDFGGLVVKAVAGSAPNQTDPRDAGVLGCGLFGSGTTPASSEWLHAQSVQVVHGIGEASSAEIRLPLINPVLHDGFGYEWLRTSPNDVGQVVLWDGGEQVQTYHRGRLVRVIGGLVDEQRVLFTGTISDFEPGSDGTVTVRCAGFEQRALKTIIKNEPDAISYMTFGYRRRTGTVEPIYGIAAYDNWAIEYAIQDVLYRCGIDASKFAAPLLAADKDGVDVAVVYGTDHFRKFRARSLLGKKLKCERPVHYGNVGIFFDDTTPVDDPYVFKPEDSREPWSRVREVADRYGYDVRFDEFGDCLLVTRGNASTLAKTTTAMAAGTGTLVVKPSAFAGTVIEWSGAEAPTVTYTFTGSRLDVSMPRGPGLGKWQYLRVLRVSDDAVMAEIHDFDPYAASDTYYYDYASTDVVTNTTVVTVFSDAYDEYRLEARAASGADGYVRRMDAFLVYAKDPLTPLYPRPLSTGENAMSVAASGGTSDEMRNLVYVVGQRKTASTDSEKFATNPNNPDPEFVVQSAVDTGSITDPTAPNFVGGKWEAAIFDSTVSDQDFAAYLARTFVYRYRTLRPAAEVRHTILPVLQLRDPLYVRDATFDAVDSTAVLWCTRYTHSFSEGGKAESSITTASWPEFPSYEPREDVDIDLYFHGHPITDVEVAYTSLTGHDLVNVAAKDVIHESSNSDDVVEEVVPVTGIPLFGFNSYLDCTGLPWPPVPGTVFIGPPDVGAELSGTFSYPDFLLGTDVGGVDVLPFHRMEPGGSLDYALPFDAFVLSSVLLTQWRYDVGGSVYLKDRAITITQDPTGEFFYDWNRDTKRLTVHWSATAATPTSPVYFGVDVGYTKTGGTVRGGFFSNNPYHHFFNVNYADDAPHIYLTWRQGDGQAPYLRHSEVSSYTVRYRKLGPWAPNQFQDPYHGVSPFADPMASDLGYVARLSFDALVTGLYRVSVRSSYDGTVVAWLTEPTADPDQPESHWQYVTSGPQRVFEWDYVDQVGTWNMKQSLDYSAMVQGFFELEEKEPVSAGWVVWNREPGSGAQAPLALIAGDRDALGKPVFGQGTYASWYFHVEAKNDRLEELHEADEDAKVANPRPAIRTSKTSEPRTGETAPVYTTPDANAAIVYTHLPEPTAAEIDVHDWIGANYDPTDVIAAADDGNWGKTDSVSTMAAIHNGKPVRVRFTVKERPGALWAAKQDRVRCKVTRHVHARALVFDQFDVGTGVTYPGTEIDQHTVYTRRECIDDHTVTFPDQGWRMSRTFKNATYTSGTVEWIFLPQDFKKQFTTVPNESIRFGDYLQITEVPKWDAHRTVAGPSSRYIMGFWGMLFYLSAYVQDISGRRTWCTNRRFLDKSKISGNTYSDWPVEGQAASVHADSSNYKADWPEDWLYQQRRTVICRQWTDEPGWLQNQAAAWGFAPGTIPYGLLKHLWADHEIGSSAVGHVSWGTLDEDYHSTGLHDGRLPASFPLFRQLGTSTTTRLAGTAGRDWTWEGGGGEGPTWVPCTTRDWFPYFLLPPMPNPNTSPETRGADGNWYVIVDVRDYNRQDNTGADAGAGPVWSSWTRDMTDPTLAIDPTHSHTGSGAFFHPGSKVTPFILGFTGDPPTPRQVTGPIMDYARQDDMVHYEDLRGSFSRGSRPDEAPKKVTPVPPYYLNLYTYTQFEPEESLPQNQLGITHTSIYRYRTKITEYFRMTFRHEYIVESPAYFPTDNHGRGVLVGLQANKTRWLDNVTRASIRYDAGAWTGWKDDRLDGHLGGDSTKSIFEQPAMPVQTGPVLPETTHCFMHLCLVNERRATPIP